MSNLAMQNVTHESSPQQSEGSSMESRGTIYQEQSSIKQDQNYSTNNFPIITQVALRKIFEKCDPSEKITFSRAHDEYHELVARERAAFLAKDIVPTLIKAVPKMDLLKCRQLCRLWNNALNQLFDDTQMKYRNILDFPDKSIRNEYFPNKFKSSESIHRFLDDMHKHPGNPFPDRDVRFRHSPTQECPNVDSGLVRMDYWLHAIYLLRKFGSHVHSFTFAPDYPVSTITMCNHLTECLRLLPNLKQLNIFEDIGVVMFDDNELEPDFFNIHPLPPLHCLEEINISGANPIINRALLDSCPISDNIKSLIIRNIWQVDGWEFPEAVFNFMNLEVLQAEISTLDFERFSSRVKVPPLKVIKWSSPAGEIIVNPKIVFKALENFHDTLVCFDCSCILDVTENDNCGWATSVFNLPKLAKMCLSMFLASFDPFVHFRALTHLRVFSSPFYEQSRPVSNGSLALTCGSDLEHVQILGFAEKMYESNIWTLIPSLDYINVKGYDYYRYFYDKIRKGEPKVATGDRCRFCILLNLVNIEDGYCNFH